MAQQQQHHAQDRTWLAEQFDTLLRFQSAPPPPPPDDDDLFISIFWWQLFLLSSSPAVELREREGELGRERESSEGVFVRDSQRLLQARIRVVFSDRRPCSLEALKVSSSATSLGSLPASGGSKMSQGSLPPSGGSKRRLGSLPYQGFPASSGASMSGHDRFPIKPSNHVVGSSFVVGNSKAWRSSSGVVIREVSEVPKIIKGDSYEGRGKNVAENISPKKSPLSKNGSKGISFEWRTLCGKIGHVQSNCKMSSEGKIYKQTSVIQKKQDDGTRNQGVAEDLTNSISAETSEEKNINESNSYGPWIHVNGAVSVAEEKGKNIISSAQEINKVDGVNEEIDNGKLSETSGLMKENSVTQTVTSNEDNCIEVEEALEQKQPSPPPCPTFLPAGSEARHFGRKQRGSSLVLFVAAQRRSFDDLHSLLNIAPPTPFSLSDRKLRSGAIQGARSLEGNFHPSRASLAKSRKSAEIRDFVNPEFATKTRNFLLTAA
ncbi:hypothetical protein M5K25_024715 [Dendrobium thyrsiflorum]|uniref:Uncharacterized protein n=1 Tax=Dendrobium thyrsiflorum TaxID=117978 RepID=A0ABD0U334_DENTH